MRQRRTQVDFAVGAALGAAVGLAAHRDAARAVRGEPVQPGVVGGCCRHDLKHRPHAKGGQQAVDQRGVVRRDAFGNIVGVVARHADGGKDLAGVGLQHHDAAAGHMQVGDALAQALDVGVQGQRYPLPRAGMPCDEHRLAAGQRQPLRGGGAGGNDLVPGCRKQRIVGALQPCNALPLAVAVAQKMHRYGQRQIPLCEAAARDAQRGYIPVYRHKKQRSIVAAAVQLGLLGVGNIGQQLGVAVTARHTQGVPAVGKPGQQPPRAVIKVAAVGRQRRLALGLLQGALGVPGVLPHPIHPAQHNADAPHKTNHQRPQPPKRHTTAPLRFSLGAMGAIYTKKARSLSAPRPVGANLGISTYRPYHRRQVPRVPGVPAGRQPGSRWSGP